MKCRYCGNELSQLTGQCPLCGYDANAQDMKSILQEIIRVEGKKKLTNSLQLLSLVADLAPDLIKERKLLSYLISVHGNEMILEASGKDADAIQKAVRRAAQQISEDFSIALPKAMEISELFAAAVSSEYCPGTKTTEPSALSEAAQVQPDGTADDGEKDALYQKADCLLANGSEQDIRSALEILFPLAKEDYPPAVERLGFCYYYGKGVEKDEVKAIELFRHAASMGDSNAFGDLGFWCMEKGNAVDGAKYFARAADMGNTTAQYNLARCYELGDGIEQNDEKAFVWYRKAAEGGDISALTSVGMCYVHGNGVPKNAEKAYSCFLQAAEKGDEYAQYNLYICYKKGEGIEQDAEEAFRWLKKAAENGQPDAQYSLYVRYSDGDGVEQNMEEAYKWLKKSAENGDSDAQYELGAAYYDGKDLPKDYKKAFSLFQQAAEAGDAAAQYLLYVCCKSGRGTEQNLEDSIGWLKKAAENGHSAAQYDLGIAYKKGEGVPQDHKKAFSLFKQAAEAGDADAQYQLYICYKNGMGIEQNIENAISWLRKAADNNHLGALVDLGVSYFNGEDTPQDCKKAFTLFQKAAAAGDVSAQYCLYVCYNNGDGTGQNMEEAIRWLIKAAENGHSGAQYHLYIRYSGGEGVERNKEEALRWLIKAAENGHPSAQYDLAEHYFNEDGEGTDPARALELYRAAAENGNEDAKRLMAKIYLGGRLGTGMGILPDQKEGVLWLKRLCETSKDGLDHFRYYMELDKEDSFCYDPDRAFAELKRAEELGEERALPFLADHYVNGKGTRQDIHLARKYLELAKKSKTADQNMTKALEDWMNLAFPPEEETETTGARSFGLTKKCPNCGTTNEADSNFCFVCGKELSQQTEGAIPFSVSREPSNSCPFCGAKVEPGGLYCPKCKRSVFLITAN